MSAAGAQPRLTDGAGAESVWRGCATAGGLLLVERYRNPEAVRCRCGFRKSIRFISIG
jgi:hypothetical protein